MFSLVGGSPLRDLEITPQRGVKVPEITPKPGALGTRKGREGVCPAPPTWLLCLSSQPPLPSAASISLPSASSFPVSQLSWRMRSVVLMTHSVVHSETLLRFPEGKLQTKSNTPNSFLLAQQSPSRAFPESPQHTVLKLAQSTQPG